MRDATRGLTLRERSGLLRGAMHHHLLLLMRERELLLRNRRARTLVVVLHIRHRENHIELAAQIHRRLIARLAVHPHGWEQ